MKAKSANALESELWEIAAREVDIDPTMETVLSSLLLAIKVQAQKTRYELPLVLDKRNLNLALAGILNLNPGSSRKKTTPYLNQPDNQLLVGCRTSRGSQVYQWKKRYPALIQSR